MNVEIVSPIAILGTDMRNIRDGRRNDARVEVTGLTPDTLTSGGIALTTAYVFEQRYGTILIAGGHETDRFKELLMDPYRLPGKDIFSIPTQGNSLQEHVRDLHAFLAEQNPELFETGTLRVVSNSRTLADAEELFRNPTLFPLPTSLYAVEDVLSQHPVISETVINSFNASRGNNSRRRSQLIGSRVYLQEQAVPLSA